MTLCPRCKHKGAYVGALMVECPNFDCKNFSERQHVEWSARQETLDSEDPVDHPVYLWCTHHHDFGD